MRAGSVHPQWHSRRDGRKISGGPWLEEPFLFRFLALSGPVDGAREGCTAEKVPVRKFKSRQCASLSSTGILSHSVRDLFYTLSDVSLSICALFCTARDTTWASFSFFLCQRCRWLCARPGQEGWEAIFFLVQVNGPHHLRGSVRMGSSSERATVGLSGFRSCRTRQSPIPFFPSMVPSCWVSPKISALPCLSIHAPLLPKIAAIVWFSLCFSFVRHPSQCDMQQKGKLYVWRQI